MALTVTTIGDGAMATVCSQILASRADVTLTMWVREAAHLAEMKRDRENKRYLPGVALVEGVKLEGDAERALAGAELVLCAVPSQYMRGTLTRLKPGYFAAIRRRALSWPPCHRSLRSSSASPSPSTPNIEQSWE